MIENAAILAITRLSGYDAEAQAVYAAPVVLADVGCMLDGLTNSQKWKLGATIKDAAMVLYIPAGVIGGAAIVPGDRMTVQYEGDTVQTNAQVLQVNPRMLAGISHLEMYLKPVAPPAVIVAAAGVGVNVGRFTFNQAVDATLLAPGLFVVDQSELDLGTFAGMAIAQVDAVTVAVTFGPSGLMDPGGLPGWPWSFGGLAGVALAAGDVFPG